ncbi:hypothetical protein LIER_38116 [Lithospermum erythrorhizon]|uniref:Uncharacterized protein n=1 Tax=Lithospermum erythrorhizon TaxID=34254 RepID=A0AAV3PX34_LITER
MTTNTDVTNLIYPAQLNLMLESSFHRKVCLESMLVSNQPLQSAAAGGRWRSRFRPIATGKQSAPEKAASGDDPGADWRR